MNSDCTTKKQIAGGTCVVRLDRLIFNATARNSSGIQNVPGYKRVGDFRPHQQGKIVAYGRVLKLRSTSNTSKIDIQHDPRVPWVDPQRVAMIGHDRTGLNSEEIENVRSQCLHHTLSLVELALDFTPDSGVDCEFVLRHGRFGKSRRRLDRGGPDSLRFGGRLCPKLVRCYFKKELGCFRVELEIHRSLLRKAGVEKVSNLGTAAVITVPAHLKFVAFRWSKLQAYLNRRFGKDGVRLCDNTRRRAVHSLRAATRYLAKNGVANPHRFLAPLRINRDIKAALRSWADRLSLEEPEPWK
jgi:hypothetical protein